MSAFTKILTVLLSLASIFLCGVAVSYVASTNNAKAELDKLQSEYAVLQSSKNVATARANEIQVEANSQATKLKEKLAQLESSNSSMMIDLTTAQNTAIKWQDRVNSWAGVVKSFEQTISDMEKSLSATRQMLSEQQTKNIELSSKLNEMTTSLDEHIVMLSALKSEKRRLQEQMAALEQQVGNGVSKAVTQVRDSSVATAYMPITGLVSGVGSNLVSVSVGSSDGVKEGMKFHVTRGTTFICDIMITDVDTDVSAGVIELKNADPKTGDTVSTKL